MQSIFIFSGNKNLTVYIKSSRQSGGAGKVWEGKNCWQRSRREAVVKMEEGA